MLRVLRPGLLTTVQDLGRTGWQRYGVVVGGAMDALALRTGNLLLGNPESAAALEATLLGPQLEFGDDALFAVTGADLGARLDDVSIPVARACAARAGSVLTFAGTRSGCRAYIAVAGGIDVPVVLGSRSTDLRARLGGVNGRALATGDVLPIGSAAPRAHRLLRDLIADDRSVSSWGAGRSVRSPVGAEPVVRVLRGPEHDSFTQESRESFLTAPFTVSARSDRMGYRLEGSHLTLDEPRELITAPLVIGTVQVPPGGDPIVLLADRQSAGGYPRIAQVIAVDIPVLAQAPPGTRIRFQEVTLAAAEVLYLTRERDLRQLADAVALQSR